LKWFLGVAAACVAAAQTPLLAQTRVDIGDMGAGPSGRLLRDALERPYQLVEPDTVWYVVPRGSEIPTTLIVLGRSAAIAGTVRGDVFVVGGDLFIRPGAHVTGNATAIGGGTYPSSLGFVEGVARTFRDNTFTITRTPSGYQLDYRSLREAPSPPLLLPGIYGLRMPSYDRVNGASIPFGPAFAIDTGRVELNAIATYRSDLGKIDPMLEVTARVSRRFNVEARAERGTFTNDAWIWSDLVNSASVLAFGADTRNYYRADRIEGTLRQRWEFSSSTIEPFIGAVTENAWSVGPGLLERRGPWSLWGRTDSLGIWRPNPPIEQGRISSALLGATLDWAAQGVTVVVTSRGEANFAAPADERFEQATTDAAASFPTFGEQVYAMDAHWVTTAGDTPPPQRFAYIGGSGTLPFIDMLAEGGDELLLIDQRYSIPLPRPQLGLLGVPTILLRHRIGSAGVGQLPSFHQMIGVGVLLTLVRAEVDFDPALRKVRFGTGFSFTR
jgi:hypothetical protein